MKGTPLHNTIVRFIREPLVHFLVIGAAIFVLYGFMGQQDVEEQERAITITAGEINWLTDSLAEALEPATDRRGARGLDQTVPAGNDPLPRGGGHGPR